LFTQQLFICLSVISKEELEKSIANTTALMKQAAKDLDFMQAAQYRDEIIRLQKELEEKG
jgi:excinuclease ABC subunit B